MKPREIELLAPAANADIGIEAIKHGADAVYIGASSHGARKDASNSPEDIARLVAFAHRYRARVYVTVNTLVYDKEIKHVERLIADLYSIGVDALIIQDMGILEMNIPPIALHASTQCDTRTPAKARFLQDAGCSQIVLARELTLTEIREICREVEVPVECFVHGALCVSYSGRCSISEASCGRSANRGECAQMCRLPYTLVDAGGRVMAADRHLLSLKDFNLSDRIAELLEAGVSSFKIEGRLKEAGYVKNITALYRRIIDEEIRRYPDKYVRSSYGKSLIDFTPQADKSFNRGFTHYFLDERRPHDIASLDTPKSQGELINDVNMLNNGDGISFLNDDGEYVGVNVNKVDNGRLFLSRPVRLPHNVRLHRTSDVRWRRQLDSSRTVRVLDVDIIIDEEKVMARDEMGNACEVALDVVKDVAKKPLDPLPVFSKMGNTRYRLRNFENRLLPSTFIPNSSLSAVRNRLMTLLETINESTYPYQYRRSENPDAKLWTRTLTYQDNVANRLAEKFYSRHGAGSIERCLELSPELKQRKDLVVMTTRHCILRELGLCKKENPAASLREPLRLRNGSNEYRLRFNCRDCEMQVISDGRVSRRPVRESLPLRVEPRAVGESRREAVRRERPRSVSRIRNSSSRNAKGKSR